MQIIRIALWSINCQPKERSALVTLLELSVMIRYVQHFYEYPSIFENAGFAIHEESISIIHFDEPDLYFVVDPPSQHVVPDLGGTAPVFEQQQKHGIRILWSVSHAQEVMKPYYTLTQLHLTQTHCIYLLIDYIAFQTVPKYS